MKNIIIDTDFSPDAGDLTAVSIALALHKIGLINVIGIIVSSSNAKSPGAVNALCIAFGLPNIPIACWQGAANDVANAGPGVWVGPIYDNYTHTLGLASTVQSSLTLYTNLLNDPTINGRITIACIGGAPTIREILVAQPTLVAARIEHLVWMAGGYPSLGSEFNIAYDVPAATAVMSTWPGKVTYNGYENGIGFKVGANLQKEFASNDIVRYGVTLHSGTVGNYAWDEMAILVAVFGSALFTFVQGSNVVVGSGNSFTASSSGKDFYAVMAIEESKYAAIISNLLAFPRANSPSAWKYGRSVVTLI